MTGWVVALVLWLVCQSYPAWPDRWRRGLPAFLLHGLGALWRDRRGR